MSCAAARESRKALQMCRSCRERKARFQFRDEVRADRDHVLCFECYRSEVDRQRARRPTPSPFGQQMSADAMAHRRRMLHHLERAAT